MQLQALLLITPPILMLLLGCIPNRWANSWRSVIQSLTMVLVSLSLLVALGLASVRLTGYLPTFSVSLLESTWSPQLALSCYYDNITALMLTLVAFLGLVTCRFSVRYMDGEALQGQYFKWMSLTIGAVSLMVVSGNLLMFLLAWIGTSLGLHQLLMHYSHRPLARRAAWTKFSISRLGDMLLLIAVMLIIQVFGTNSLAELIERSQRLALTPELVSSQHSLAVWLLVLGVAIKTVQVPFHAWLPDTLETPTPVSALMHAGVVNAGGYLLIRISPMLALEPNALTALSVIGAATASLGVVVMSTQTSVKRSLAYSTVAQMGFMMLQCGLGAFSAAMVHLLAHSIYKAYAFLSSGTVDLSSNRSAMKPALPGSQQYFVPQLFGSIVGVVALVYCTSLLFQLDLAAKQGSMLLALIMVLALSSWSWKLLLSGTAKARALGLSAVAATCIVSICSYKLIDILIGGSIYSVPFGLAHQWISLLIGLGFSLLFLLHVIIVGGSRYTWLERTRIHASNGFYFGAVYQRLFSNVLTS